MKLFNYFLVQEEESEPMFNNLKLKDFLAQIRSCVEKNQPIEIEGFGYNNCLYAKLKQEEEEIMKNKKKDKHHEELFI